MLMDYVILKNVYPQGCMRKIKVRLVLSQIINTIVKTEIFLFLKSENSSAVVRIAQNLTKKS